MNFCLKEPNPTELGGVKEPYKTNQNEKQNHSLRVWQAREKLRESSHDWFKSCM